MRTRNWLMALGLMAALAGSAFVDGALAQGGDIIAQRRAGLKRMGEHMQALKATADGRLDPRPMAARVDDMLAWFEGMPGHFPAGSNTGDTRALPSVWADTPGFVQANGNAITALRTLRETAASGDSATFAQAFAATGTACGACHRSFRAPSR